MAAMKQQATMDGNQAAAYVAYAFTDVAAIYPITPSSTMAEYVDEWQAAGRKNIFGQTVSITEMQSEGGAAGALHGALAAGALGSTFTASQGLLLMIPNMYKIAGELLPGVMHVSARTLAGHTLSIFGDHSDIMACTQTGFAMLCSANVQEAMDLAAVAHLAAIKGSLPFLHFFDGFRTSHEQQKIEIWDYKELAAMLDWQAVQKFRARALNPEHPCVRGTAQNPDIYFQAREAANSYHQALPAIVADYMQKVSERTGRSYRPFDYYGDPEATDVIVAMGSIGEVACQAVDYLRAQGRKVGFVQVRLFRPFVPEYMFAVLPQTVQRLAVLDRVKVPGSATPLHQDVLTAFYEAGRPAEIIGGRYGLASKDTVPADIVGVFNNLAAPAAERKNNFTVSINDDVYHTSVTPEPDMPDMLPAGTIQCKFWGLGSDGTVGANKQAVAIINDETDLNAQAYFSYDSKKSGGITISHLRFGKEKIKAPYLIRQADFVSCSNASYVNTYDLLEGLKPGGTFLLNCKWQDDELEQEMPAAMKRYIAANNIKFYTIDALSIAQELGLGKRTNMIMQSAFFKLANIIPVENAVAALDASIEHAYGRKGQNVVDMNKKAVTAGLERLHQVTVPQSWQQAETTAADAEQAERPEFARKILDPINAQQGDKLPVSAFMDMPDGTFPTGTAKLEKRGVAPFVPEWLPENCIQCNRCAMVCPHASIRPILLTEEEKAAAPAEFISKKAIGKGLEGLEVRLQVSPLDCQGCSLCAEICPAKQKALKMVELDHNSPDVANWEYAMTVSSKDDRIPADNVKNVQLRQPYLEFSGACAGCGETPYAKLVTQMFGERMIIANATGCSSIWGASAPAMPYTTNAKGQGPAWANSLFEDNAEYGLGMALAVKQQRERLVQTIEQALQAEQPPQLAAALQNWLDKRDDVQGSRQAADELLPLLADSSNALLQSIYAQKDYLTKQSIWIFGGDGWAYDIGYGGLDHVLASGENVNVLVFDTEVYSNTGGQSSKSTPTSAIAKFSVTGKKTKKKDLGMMAMSYGYVYVAQIAMGADMNQTLKALREAEAYDGPSLVIAYSHCINHGIKAGMNKGLEEQARAVQAGYWHLYRYNPSLRGSGQNPFMLDSKAPTADLREFLLGEVRYDSLFKIDPEHAEQLFAKTAKDAQERYESYKRLAEQESK